MPNILRAEKRARGERLKKNPRLNQPGDGLKPKAADRLDLLVYFAQLRNAIRRKRQALHRLPIFGAGMCAVRRLQRLPNGTPNLMLFRRVGGLRNFLSRLIAERELRDTSEIKFLEQMQNLEQQTSPQKNSNFIKTLFSLIF